MMNSHDIVVWNGAITTFGTIKDLLEITEEVYLANEEEIARYKELKKTEK